MPLIPGDPNSWDEYLLQVYNARLSSVLEKEKAQFENEITEAHDKLKLKLLDHLKILNQFLNYPSEHPQRHPFPYSVIRLRKLISETVSEELYWMNLEYAQKLHW